MSVNCSNIGLFYSADDFCLPITLTVDSEDFSVNESWIAGAFFLGLFVGAGLTALCVRPFLISWEKKKVCIFSLPVLMATNGTIPAGKLSPLSRAVPFQRVVCFCSCLIYELKNTHVILEYRLLERKREWVGMGGGVGV